MSTGNEPESQADINILKYLIIKHVKFWQTDQLRKFNCD